MIDQELVQKLYKELTEEGEAEYQGYTLVQTESDGKLIILDENGDEEDVVKVQEHSDDPLWNVIELAIAFIDTLISSL